MEEEGGKGRVVLREALERAGGVCFDVDSTVCPTEGIDELARHCNAADAVAAWLVIIKITITLIAILTKLRTKKAMEGGVSFREALVARLNIIKPTKHQVDSFLIQNPPALTPGVRQGFLQLLILCCKRIEEEGGTIQQTSIICSNGGNFVLIIIIIIPLIQGLHCVVASERKEGVLGIWRVQGVDRTCGGGIGYTQGEYLCESIAIRSINGGIYRIR